MRPIYNQHTTKEESPLMDGIDSVIGSDMTGTVFVDPADLLI